MRAVVEMGTMGCGIAVLIGREVHFTIKFCFYCTAGYISLHESSFAFLLLQAHASDGRRTIRENAPSLHPIQLLSPSQNVKRALHHAEVQ